MPFRYLLKQLILPPGFFFLLLLLAWWLRRSRPRLAAISFVVSAGGLWLMSLPIVVEWAARGLETEPPLVEQRWADLALQADAIVVLGAGRERGDPGWGGEDQPTAIATERLRYAARLAKATGLPLLITGGLHYGSPPSEADIMAQSLERDFGVSVRWKEGRSRTTWENAQFSAALLGPEFRRVVLVTQAWHMQRSRWSFEQAGFGVITAPMGFWGVDNARPFGGWLPESKAMWQSGMLLNEAVGLIGYRLFYRSASDRLGDPAGQQRPAQN
ncbi:YdcF family protein [Pseudomonas sp. R5(2019)]|uniref:YdcF family protein n=1 Tax=Pseudomonas sp. R5(2019) TaxID=2697566 RepID=UPI001413366A|nr:YdcF family protein [Pseudomonas sp. R5(2019)]NBA97470.1 YdcF family protein [Pseudomonas sp. R5(2019)]